MKNIYCSIITIGDELLIGQTIDTNSAWIAQKLNGFGIQVRKRIAVGDLAGDIVDTLNEERKWSDIIILTGGLGPTSDDITKPVLCQYFNCGLVENREVSKHIQSYFEKRNRPMLESNLKQSWVPENCKVLFNAVGTAPGMLFNVENQIIISLPGVPFEMQYIIENHVLEILRESFHPPSFVHKTLLTSGEGESFIAERLIEFEQQLPPSIKIAYLPSLNIVKLRLTAIQTDHDLLELQFQKLKSILENIYVFDEDKELEQVLGIILSKTKQTISVAESCTGGTISARIASVSGASKYFKGGIVPYTIECKENLLEVDHNIINQYTVVSRETVINMATQCIKKFDSNYAVSVSGYLEKDDHDNMVWIGLSDGQKSIAKKITAPYDRQKNTQLVANAALNLLRQFILKQI